MKREDLVTQCDLGGRRTLKELQQALTFALSRAAGYQAALTAVLKKTCEAVGWAYAEAWLTSHSGDILKPGPAWPQTPAFADFRVRSRKLGFRRGNDLPGRVLSARRSEWVEDVSTVPQRVFGRRTSAAEVGLKAALALPLFSAGDVLGVLVFYASHARPRSADVVDYVAAALSPLGPVLERKGIEETLRVRARQQEAVARLGLEALKEGAKIGSLAAKAVALLTEMLGVEYGEILERKEGNVLEQRAGLDGDDGDDAHGRYALRANEPVLVEDLSKEDRFLVPRRLREHDVASGVCVVIPGHGRAIGVLGAYSVRRRRFTHTELSFLQGVANVIGPAIERRRTEKELERHRRELERTVAERTARLAASCEQLCRSKRLASIGTLAAGLGHDMQNVLLPVLCRLDALAAADLPEASREDLQAIRHSLDYLQRASRGLRLFALERGAPEASDGMTRLDEWWETVSPFLEGLLLKGVAVCVSLPPALPPVRISEHLLSQAVLNLLVNAREATGGRGNVRIWAEAAADNLWVRLGVSDDGHGMSVEVQHHALEPFFTTRKRRLGTGLGLSVVHGVVRAAGGSIHIDSCPGGGTSVVLTLAAVHAPRAAPSDSVDADMRVASVSILDRRTSAYVSSLLGSAGFSVHETATDSPVDSVLWVTASECRPAVARYLAGDPGRRVLVLGRPAGPVGRARVTHAVDPSDLEGLRRALRATVHATVETTDAF
ncbi:MAG: ATP-binding protein [Planctomycetota bacterium]